MIVTEWDNLIVTDNVLTNLPISQLSSIPTLVGGLDGGDLLLVSRPCDPSAMTDTGYMSYSVSFNSLSAWISSALSISFIENDIDQLYKTTNDLMQFYDMLTVISQSSPSAEVDITDETGRFNPYVISAIYAEKGTILTSLGGYRFADSMSNIFGWKKFNVISASTGKFDVIGVKNTEVINVSAETEIVKQLSVSEYAKIADVSAETEIVKQLSVSETISAGMVLAQSSNVQNLTADNISAQNLIVNNRPYQHLSVMTQADYDNAEKMQNYFYFTYQN